MGIYYCFTCDRHVDNDYHPLHIGKDGKEICLACYEMERAVRSTNTAWYEEQKSYLSEATKPHDEESSL